MHNVNVSSCWFYKLCRKECKKDVTYIFAGIAIILLMLILFRWIISTYQIIFLIVGGYLVVSGFSALFSKLPKVKAFLRTMPPEWYATLGEQAPRCSYRTFYLTEFYLCIPSEYIMIRYCDIARVMISNTMSSGVQTGITLKLALSDGSKELDISVSDWKGFQQDAERFVSYLNDRKQAMLAASGMGSVQ